MKKMLIVLAGIIYAFNTFATISQNQAFRIGEQLAKDTTNEIMVSNFVHHVGDSIMTEGDYLICPFDSAWCVFIDYYPLHDWRHECAYVFVDYNSGDALSIIKNTPPAYISKLWTKYRTYSIPQEQEAEHKSLILERLNPNAPLSLLRNNPNIRENGIENENYPETFAIIINCAYSPDYNYERYWNDCAGMYSTFRNYGLSRENIFTAMGYGNDSLPDLRLNSGDLIISPKDLDGDGFNDIRYPATMAGVEQIFEDLSDIIDANDIVNIYINGMGDIATGWGIGEDVCLGNYASCLFNNGHLFDSYMGYLVSELSCNVVNVFIQRTLSENLSACIQSHLGAQRNYVITNNISSGIVNYQYDQFTYDLFSALNSFTPDSVAVVSDYNNDGIVSMNEVYVYLANQANPATTYSQESNPLCLAEKLSVIGIFDEDECLYSDLYIRDNNTDNGAEPNMSTNKSYITPDMWAEDLAGNMVNVLNSGETYYICALIHNRGNITSTGDEVLHLHWTKAVIGGRWPESWIEGAEYNCNGTSVSVGGEITSTEGFPLPPIDAYETYVARILWTTPDNSIYSPCSEFVGNNNELWHYCLLARIYDEHESPGEDLTPMPMNDFVLHSNNVASRNITIMSQTNNNGLTSVVGITVPYSGCYSLVGKNLNYPELSIGTGGLSMHYTLSQNLAYSWWHIGEGIIELDGNYLQIDSNVAILHEIYLDEGEMYSLKLDIDAAPTNYMYDIELIDQNGFPLGGEVFKVLNVNTRHNMERRNKQQSNNQSINTPPAIECTYNPKAKCLHVNAQENNYHITVLNCAGNIIERQENVTLFEMSSLPTGIYIIVIETDSNVQQFKVVKQ